MATTAVFVLLCALVSIADAKSKSAGSVQSPVLNPDPNAPIDTNAETLGNKLEGDMVLPPGMSPDGKNRNALTDKTYHWTNAKVCYWFDTSSTSVRQAVKDAIAEYENFTCIRFHERVGTETPCIRIFQGQGCYSSVGMMPNGQDLSLGSGCEYKGTAEHELMHALGYSHEQSRGDRDEYLNIMWQNIQPGKEGNFEKRDIGYSTYGYPYDFNSVMQYGFTSFSKNGERTMVPKDPNFQFPPRQREGFTELDIKKLNKVYCDAATAPAGTFKTLKDITQYKTTIVDWMNKVRRTVGASNMKKLSWNDQLATGAAAMAQECTDVEYKAATDNSKFTIRFAHSSNYTDLERAIAPIFSAYESQIANSLQNYYITDQYQQLLNANASDVGCALSVCQGLKASNKSEKAEYFQAVCTFSPMVVGVELYTWNWNPYLVGTGCSLCTGHTCDNGLCVGGRICSNKRDCECGLPNNPIVGKFVKTEDISPYQQYLVDAMNAARKSIGATGMMKLTWDSGLATEAAALAGQCTAAKVTTTAASHSALRYVAEQSCSDLSEAFQPVLAAFQKTFTDYATTGKCSSPDGFYRTDGLCPDLAAVIVNGVSSKVGCAVSKCNGLKNSTLSPNMVYYQGACVWDPPMTSAYNAFKKGVACSQCSGACEDGLCLGRVCVDKRDCECGIPSNPNVGKVLSTEDISAYKDGLVNAMNTARGSIGAAAMLKLTWDDALAAEAASITNQCSQSANTLYTLTAGNHSSIRIVADQSCSDVSAAFAPVIAAFTKTYTDFVATNKCTSPDFFTSTGYCPALAAAVINAASNKVGCAVTKCSGLTGNTKSANFTTYLGACVFDPPMGSYWSAFTKGTACSQCTGGTCEGGLCVGGRICFDNPNHDCVNNKRYGCDILKQYGYECGKTCGWC